ncbi:MAG TPA: response regulator transcription factor [Prosthecochloris aestuarii]|jgi:DNA-binding response OmpR family regulator|uniref:Response regulator transcription factor n=1 Tax=Prosthecochloris aestuarii TaxID=1102 RepID=A0A831WN10_PROAE|nr:response regulator transcription factor [Prosthecochloris sp.]HED30173.1 response regulator transcription factor [Prosthecochloris aestuarii]
MEQHCPQDIQHNKRIIIVEDDRDFRESMVESLILAGFDVTGVASALDFYKHIALQNYLLAILDLGLPDQNGIVLAEYIRNNTDMRIIVLTAQGSLDSRVSAYQAGADIYLLKPVNFSELTASITSILGRLEKQSSTGLQPRETVSSEPRTSAPWVLVQNKMVLLSPQGSQVKLSSKEYDLIEMLVTFSGQVVSRQELLNALGYAGNKSGNRSLDVLIYRLRQKKTADDYRIPVKTVHGLGYSFSEPVVMD